MSAGTASSADALEELQQFLYLVPVAVVKLGSQGEVQMMTPQAVKLLQDLDLDCGLLDGPGIMEALSPGLASEWRAHADDLGEICPARHVALAIDRDQRHLVLRVVRTDPRCTMLTLEDVTETVQQQQEIARQRQRLGVVMEHIEGYCVVMLDLAGRIQEWNPSIGRMFGQSRSSLVGQSVDRLLEPVVADDRRALVFGDVAATVARQGVMRREAHLRGPKGESFWADVVVTPTVEGDGDIDGHVVVIRDVTEQHLAREKLLSDAMTDPLTGLANRRGLEHLVQAWLDNSGGLARASSWIMADVDHFKRVNDTYGHEVGDQVLKRMAQILQGAARADDVVARLGGEEFLVFLPGVALKDAMQAAERMRAGVAGATMQSQDGAFRITSSFGVAENPAGIAWPAVVARCDQALYAAKREGRNRVEPALAVEV